jgi:hypothetical protein
LNAPEQQIQSIPTMANSSVIDVTQQQSSHLFYKLLDCKR